MNRFERLFKPLSWFMALLLIAFLPGCGGGAEGSPSASLLASTTVVAATNPTISSESPSYGATNVPTSTNNSNNVVTGTVVTVGFNQPMDPATIN